MNLAERLAFVREESRKAYLAEVASLAPGEPRPEEPRVLMEKLARKLARVEAVREACRTEADGGRARPDGPGHPAGRPEATVSAPNRATPHVHETRHTPCSRDHVPSVLHQAPLILLEERPDLLLALLGRPVGEGERVAMQSAELTQTLPVERRADAVITIEQGGAITAAFVVEVQLAVDPDKTFAWPFYAAAVHARYRCPTTLVVLAATSEVATWARSPMPSFGHGAWSPYVFGPEEVPRITSREEARQNPQLAVLSAITHGREPEGSLILDATLHALAPLAPPQREGYTDLLHSLLGKLALAAIEAFMPIADNPFKGSLQRGFLEDARLEGTLAECRKLLLAVFAERGFGTSEATRARVEAERDLETLERWVRRAVSAATEDAVFAPV